MYICRLHKDIKGQMLLMMPTYKRSYTPMTFRRKRIKKRQHHINHRAAQDNEAKCQTDFLHFHCCRSSIGKCESGKVECPMAMAKNSKPRTEQQTLSVPKRPENSPTSTHQHQQSLALKVKSAAKRAAQSAQAVCGQKSKV